MGALEYRSDVDGLRAVAVLAVVAFHAGLGVPGGFVGVDVFFVISGFLITSIVAADLDRGRFTLADFWSRRIRRIWPAAAVMSLVTLLAGVWIMQPLDLRRTAIDAAFHVLMLANVRFWMRLDYFAEISDLVPLLHLWSLAVEEQFYLVFPPFFAWLYKRRGRLVFTSLLAVAAASFIACIPFMKSEPSAVFYLVPFRAWELLFGSILAVVPYRLIPSRTAAVLGWAGLSMIVWSCFALHRDTPFPGPAALPPVFGTALVIAAGNDANATLRRWLGAEPLRRVGLASYSLYLWHWPLLALARYTFGMRLSFAAIAAVLTATAFATVLSYRFVEIPFRAADSPSWKRRACATAVVASLSVFVLSIGVGRLGWVSGRFDPRVESGFGREAICLDWEFDRSAVAAFKASDGLPGIGVLGGAGVSGEGEAIDFLLWGDSHGMAISHVVDRAAQQHGLRGRAMLVSGQIGLGGRPPPGERFPRPYDEVRYRSSMLEWIRINRPANVILCSRWSEHLLEGVSDARALAETRMPPRASPEAMSAFDEGLEELLELCGSIDAKIWFLREVPFQDATPGQMVSQSRLAGPHGAIAGVASRDDHDQRQRDVRDCLVRFNSPRFEVIDLAEPLLASERATIIGRDGNIWYADDDHLNRLGANAAEYGIIDRMMSSMGAF